MMKWHILNNYPMLGLDVCCQPYGCSDI